LEETLILARTQALRDQSPYVVLDGRSFPVRETSRSKLREVNFQFDGHMWRGLEQNHNTSSRWAQLAREGKKVMQFLIAGRYIANVVDGKVHFTTIVRKERKSLRRDRNSSPPWCSFV
jgi:hypothetical protein